MKIIFHALILILVVSTLGQEMSVNNRPKNQTQHRNGAQENTKGSPENPPLRVEVVALPKDESTEEAKRYNDSSLNESRKERIANEQIVTPTWIAAYATVFAVIFSVWTWWRVQKRTEIQMRAYLSIEGDDREPSITHNQWDGEGGDFGIKFWIRNTGQTPAKNISCLWRYGTINRALSSKLNQRFIQDIGSHESAPFTTEISIPDDIMKGAWIDDTTLVRIWGTLNYKDVFGVNQDLILEFFISRNPWNDPGGLLLRRHMEEVKYDRNSAKG